MKTHKEEAEALRDKLYYEGKLSTYDQAVKCAIIDVEGKIHLLNELFYNDDAPEIYQAISTPNKLFVDVLNPKKKRLEQVLNHLKQM